MNYVKLLTVFFTAFIAFFALEGPWKYKYTVVIDPGHGGLSLNPISLHGDKYDPVEGKYLGPYHQGASYKNLNEGEIAFDIGKEAYDILKLTQTSDGRKDFLEILNRYGVKPRGDIEPVGVYLSRPEGYTIDEMYSKSEGKTDKDYNEMFRMFDFPDFKTGERKPGLISRINNMKPDLVVSLHLDSIGPPHGAMAAVVTPGFETYKKALEYISGNRDERSNIYKEFVSGPYRNWIQMNSSRSAFEWFLCDSWIYFTGFWSKKNGLSVDTNIFRGIRQDYVDWVYQGDSWRTRKVKPETDILKVNLNDKFWKREQDEPEKWRREGGVEGIGGDNYYASNEILRFIRLGLLQNHALNKNQLPDIREPHWSTWSLPTYINAINAFIELGFLNNKYDRERITKYKKLHAEAIAVGIYSLLYGLEIPDVNIRDMPVGEHLLLSRYKNYNGLDYFKTVVE